MALSHAQIVQAEGSLFSLFEELFSLGGFGVLKRQLLAVARGFVRLSFHGSILKWVRLEYDRCTTANKWAELTAMLTEMLWPNGVLAEVPPVRPAEEQHQSHDELLARFIEALPTSVESFVGPTKAKQAACKLHSFLQNSTLLASFLYSVLDLLLLELYDDIEVAGIGHLETPFADRYKEREEEYKELARRKTATEA